MEPAPIGESITSGQTCADRDEPAESVAVTDSRRTRDTNMADVEMIADDLEEEFRKLCGEDQPASLQACDRVRKAVNNIEVRIVAEVSKVMRCGHPGRDKIEQVGRMATEEAMSELGTLRVRCKESAVVEKWVQIVLESLGCCSRAEGVERLAELLELRDELVGLGEAYGVTVEGLVQRFDELVRENALLQEEASRQRCELDELAEVKKRLAEREAGLLRLRQQVELPMGTVKESAAEEHPGWLRRQRIQGKDDDSRAQDSEQMGSPSGEDPAYEFDAFLESFVLKYPRDSWAGAERGVAVEADRAEARNHRIVALGELKKLRMKEGQSVADFCVELERLTRHAHPHMDEAALDAQRAQLLYEHLAHWNDSYHLMEALESEGQAYERLKHVLGYEVPRSGFGAALRLLQSRQRPEGSSCQF
ncbi:unnamed protein product [Heligmosomoides polygyrus]|uniref:Retrotrans_gag domain-containing protein n=1 Tax=Heligmosomoides polygyrus TaxID=6339 RepID=A0A183FGY6_HELPZ|nr:unnamed protein product [Heligmosomoides polygyrus]